MSHFFDGLPHDEPSRQTGYAVNTIDRRSEQRSAESAAEALADPAARLYLFAGEAPILKAGNDPLFTAGEVAMLHDGVAGAILLGWAPAGPRLALQIPEDTVLDETRMATAGLRALAVEAVLPAEHLGALAQARALLNWHNRHGFCSVCGHQSTMAIGGYRRDCPNCNAQHFPRTDPVVIMLAIDTAEGRDRVLLGRSHRFISKVYSCLAGFLEPGETIEDAVRRETLEESGIRVGRVRYHASQPWPFPTSLMIGCLAEAVSTAIHRDETELEDCRWFTRDEVKQMLAGTHPEELAVPVNMAIASHLIRAWAFS